MSALLSSAHSINEKLTYLLFVPTQAAESEVSFGTLDGKDVRIGIIRTRWNSEHVGNLVEGCRKALKECNVKEENIFETEVPGSFELPLAARFLALTGTVDAIVTAGVLIKGDVRFILSLF
jgi:6,7-dimethyl-8-ribityllumazine synthase